MPASAVTARDSRTGKEQTVEVKPSYGLTEEQVESMIRESFNKAEEDMRERQLREARVKADAILAATDTLRHHYQKIEALNQTTTKLAENILNTTIRTL
jgi:molecular chaperone DnaK (HSP70)